MERIGDLKERKDKLLFRKEEIINKKPSKFLKLLYCFGIIATGVFSSINFWNKTPSLVFCLTYLYSVSVPVFYERKKDFEIGKIEHEIADIDSRINSVESIKIVKKTYENEEDLHKEFESIRRKNDAFLNNSYEEYYNVEEKVDEGPKLRLRM